VLFLDEPFNGIDVVTSRAIRNVLTRATEEGVTIFFSSHVLEVVERLCRRIAIIDEGHLRAVGDLPALRERAGLSAEATLEDVFLELLGEPGERGDLSWMGG
jgi:ABC-2 type transport system ATP-binding protein